MRMYRAARFPRHLASQGSFVTRLSIMTAFLARCNLTVASATAAAVAAAAEIRTKWQGGVKGGWGDAHSLVALAHPLLTTSFSSQGAPHQAPACANGTVLCSGKGTLTEQCKCHWSRMSRDSFRQRLVPTTPSCLQALCLWQCGTISRARFSSGMQPRPSKTCKAHTPRKFCTPRVYARTLPWISGLVGQDACYGIQNR